MKIVIADDSQMIVERLVDFLSDVPGVELIGKAGDVLDARRCIQQQKPDMVILDLQMPGGNGLDILRAIRNERPELLVMICTNYTYPQYREACMAAGANYFVDKSAEFGEIPTIVRGLVRSVARAGAEVRCDTGGRI